MSVYPRNWSLSRRQADPVRRDRSSWFGYWPVAWLLLLLLLLLPVAASAQGPYSMINVGANIETDDARMAGRGGWGMAERDTLLPGFKNLAGLPPLRGVTLLLSGFAESRQSDSEVASRATRRVFTPNLRGAIPLLGDRGMLTAGFRSRRATQYTAVRPMTWIVESDTISGQEEFIREGTQFDIPIGLAWRLSPRVGVGASLNLVRGSIKDVLNDFFDEPTSFTGVPLYLVSSQTRREELSGTSATFAVSLAPFDRLHLGGSYTVAHDVEVKRTVEMGNVAAKADSVFELHMPSEWSVGAAVQLHDRWRCGVDYDVRAFSQFSGRDDWAADMVDEWTLAFGFERKRAEIRRGGLRNLPLRLGAFIRRWAYKVGENEIRERRLAFGTGFPLQKGAGHLDLAISYAWVGNLADNGSEDRIWRLTVSVTGMEKWW